MILAKEEIDRVRALYAIPREVRTFRETNELDALLHKAVVHPNPTKPPVPQGFLDAFLDEPKSLQPLAKDVTPDKPGLPANDPLVQHMVGEKQQEELRKQREALVLPHTNPAPTLGQPSPNPQPLSAHLQQNPDTHPQSVKPQEAPKPQPNLQTSGFPTPEKKQAQENKVVVPEVGAASGTPEKKPGL